MKINDIKGLELEQVATRQTEQVRAVKGQASAEQGGGEHDVIRLSPQSRLMQKAGEVAYQTPEVRPEKVAALQDPVQQGTYEVDSQKVANSMIAGMIQEK
jgi:flagellar biosynthesis anti-sigma factor FlgM|uniref:Negative regulator of flagellin synthesis n=1 Tax=Desulfobacca acetoxidans TaxID=60893 RepID=A0A7V6A6E9_9BACT